MSKRPKYSLPEIERRWTVDDRVLSDIGSQPKVIIIDKYLSGTRLRLRSMDGGSGVKYKLGKKYGDNRNYSESITNIYLSSEEYELLRQSTGVEVTKTRYRIAGGSLDIYTDDQRPIIFSVEFRSEAEAMIYQPPEFVLDEVTDNQAYSGYVLAVGEK